jgi:hypothetical protein
MERRSGIADQSRAFLDATQIRQNAWKDINHSRSSAYHTIFQDRTPLASLLPLHSAGGQTRILGSSQREKIAEFERETQRFTSTMMMLARCYVDKTSGE